MEIAARSNQPRYDVATLAGGCFWCLEAVFDLVRGVESVKSGYTGGRTPDPTYESVCTGQTGHAEAVRITFDPSVISYRDLLEIFFAIHDPTTLNRQGNDSGTQYRSAIFYHDPLQQEIAERMIQTLTEQKRYPDPIVTEVVPASQWYEAEAYHQKYFQRNLFRSYCQYVVGPKVAKFRKEYTHILKA